MIYIKKSKEIDWIRKSSEILRKVFEKVDSEIRVGLKAKELDEIIHDEIRRMGAEPAFLGYRGYPASSCISFNEEVVHGIPDERRFERGDVIKVDIGVRYKGYFSDAAKTYYLNDNNNLDVNRLLNGTKLALLNGMEAIREGIKLGNVSNAIEKTAKMFNLGVIKLLGGHGVGIFLHEDPFVPNFGEPEVGPVLKEGYVLAIEPMFSLGTGEVKEKGDGWTYVTRDGSLAAHFEETVLVTKYGYENLTKVVYG
ncbi:MAG: type I methionyl aminopeptidase [Candidatus Hydrothermia bacterium]